MKTNVNSFYWFLEYSRKNKSTLVYASSAATYGSLPSPQTIGKECPENPYGYSKYVMDKVAGRFSSLHPELRIIGLRFFNVYGGGEFYKNKTSSMVIQLGHQILDGKPPVLFEKSDEIFRDFVYIDDVIQANINACFSNRSGVYNVGSGLPRSFQEISDILQIELSTNLGNKYIDNPFTGYQFHTQADISLTKKFLNYSPKFSLEDGIKDYIPKIVKLHNQENF